MGAIDAFFALKAEDKKNGYLPYVLKLDYVMSGLSLDEGSDRYWALLSLLQFVTGSKSRAMPTQVIDAAVSWLQDYSLPAVAPISFPQKRAIDNVVFQHKLILIENKTLTDTVQPTQHWTLKAAAKRGCACCAPEDDDDDEEAEDMGALAGKLDMSRPGAMNVAAQGSRVPNSNRTHYVDGKTAFAFDPSKFSI
jgi:hypothetical protein